MRPGPTCRSRRGTPLAACESTRCGRRAAARSRELTRRFSAGPKPGRISFYAELGGGYVFLPLALALDDRDVGVDFGGRERVLAMLAEIRFAAIRGNRAS